LYEYNKKFNQIEKKDGKYIYTKTGQEVDLHKHFVDEILLEKDGKTYRRIPELLDVWFDSGSMPYALAHIMAVRNGIDSEKFFEYMDKLVDSVEKENTSFDYRDLKNILDNPNLFKFPANFIAE
jgi:isoleucyl-tRNA synthetase